MPQTKVVFYRESDGSVPVKLWLEALHRENPRAFAKCVARIQLLAGLGYELRRPHADVLRDGIHELRARRGRVNYRILYFFHGNGTAVLSCGLKKEGEVPEIEIVRTLKRKQALESNPSIHILEEDMHDQERSEQ